MSIRKAVFPAAGLGTRFLPATKAQPKEMLPIVDKPTIQYIIEEAIASGIEERCEMQGFRYQCNALRAAWYVVQRSMVRGARCPPGASRGGGTPKTRDGLRGVGTSLQPALIPVRST